MMDDSEAQMETDVSSTTTDMPEAQEITRSNCDVEMIIVVEQIKDEEETLSGIEKSVNSDEELAKSVFHSMKCPDDITEMDKPSSQTEKSSSQTEKPSSQTLISDSPHKDKQTADILDLKDANSASTNVTLTHPEQSKTSTISHIKIVSSSTQVESLAVDADSSSKVIHNLEDNTSDRPENIVQSEQYQSQSDHQYAAKNHPEPMELADQPIIDTMVNISVNTEVPTTSGNEEDIDNLIKKENDTKTLESSIPIDTQQKQISNNSQTDIISDTTEKEHNKSISRELKSLINSAKESKIISECTQLTSKTRKSRGMADSASTSLNSHGEAEKIQGNRRSSNNSQRSSCSEKSDKATVKRSMRSQNPEFVNKVKQFLNSVTGKGQKTDSEEVLSDEERHVNKDNENDATITLKKKKILNDEVEDKINKLRTDLYCWRCHWAVEQAANEKTHHPMQCTVCPRIFHYKCLSGTERAKIDIDKNWVCPECLSVLHAESSETRSPAMKKVPLGILCELLKYALERMMDLNGVEPFIQPVDRTAFPDYDKYVVHPMDLTLIKNNINEGLYGSTEAFLADTQWILHNSIIFNTLQSKLTGGARALVRSCRTEMGEIEACPECYAAAHARRPTWFTDVCSTPHILLWAKLKGFPHWPAKGMSVNNSGLVDVRFFGAHDRAWVPAKDCYLYSEKDPNNFRTKRQDILDSMQEAEQHIRNISRKYGKFVYPPFKTQLDPSKLTEQLKLMIPSFEGEVKMSSKEKSGATPQTPKQKSRLNSKSSKSYIQDGDTSEGDEIVVMPTRKMADGAEIATEEEDYSINEKNMSMPVNNDKQKGEISRKRRRSELEEAVITIIDCSSTVTQEKRKRCDDVTSEEENKTNTAEQKDGTVIQEISEESSEKLETNVKKDNEPSNSGNEKNDVVESTTPKTLPKVKPVKTSTPKAKESIKGDINNENFLTSKQGSSKLDKSNTGDKEEKSKTPKRWNSRNKYLNVHAEKSLKNVEKTNVEVTNVKENKETNANNKIKDNEAEKSSTKKNLPIKTTPENPKSVKERMKFDDDTSLAVIARVAKNNVNNNVSCLPTISSVRSLSVTPSNECSPPKVSDSVEIIIEETSVSSVFTPTSTDNVRNMKEAVSKLKKLRNETEASPVGRVGVRSFARMISPETLPKEKELLQVEIKTEPVDLDDTDRHNEKMDLMNAFKLRPVNPAIKNNLRDLQINKVVVSPINARKNSHKQSELRVKAKKTFPQPKKVDEGRSELNGKNSMVYIPIQPPMTQAPIRGVRPIAINSSNPRLPAPVLTTLACNINTVTAPLIPHTVTSSVPNVSLASTNTCNVLSTVPPAGLMSTSGQVPTVRQASVQSLPFLTSVNGQWTFSLQPIMSVGGVEESPTPVMNGVAERGGASSVLPIANQSAQISTLPSTSTLNTNSHATSSPAPSSATCTQANRKETPAELPKLQQRPPLPNPLDASTPMGGVPPPSTAGPLTARINQNAVKLTDFFRTLLEDSLEKIDEPIAQLTTAKLQLEQAKWLHEQEIDEIKHNHKLVIAEMRASFEKEKMRAVTEVWRSAHADLDAAVKHAKSKQWCANCSQEAQFYCCWNTSYCDYPCQRAHWSKHFSMCTQKRQDNESADGAPPLDNARHAKDNLPKSTQAPTLAVGNQLNPVRVFSQDQPAGGKPSIIVSMVEDSSGNQTMKCVGTFKPQPSQTLAPLNINKQIMNKEEAAKKVVTSGGYLIVGGGSTNNTSLTTQRRPPTIQYFS